MSSLGIGLVDALPHQGLYLVCATWVHPYVVRDIVYRALEDYAFLPSTLHVIDDFLFSLEVFEATHINNSY